MPIFGSWSFPLRKSPCPWQGLFVVLYTLKLCQFWQCQTIWVENTHTIAKVCKKILRLHHYITCIWWFFIHDFHKMSRFFLKKSIWNALVFIYRIKKWTNYPMLILSFFSTETASRIQSYFLFCAIVDLKARSVQQSLRILCLCKRTPRVTSFILSSSRIPFEGNLQLWQSNGETLKILWKYHVSRPLILILSPFYF